MTLLQGLTEMLLEVEMRMNTPSLDRAEAFRRHAQDCRTVARSHTNPVEIDKWNDRANRLEAEVSRMEALGEQTTLDL